MAAGSNPQDFRTKILKASRNLTQENVEEIKFLLKGQIGDGVLERINTTLDLIRTLENLGYITLDKIDFFHQLLKDIDRQDIANELMGQPYGTNTPNITTGTRLRRPEELLDRRILDSVANHIAADWKRLSRALQITEAKIDQIDMDNRKAYEKALQCLNAWQQIVGRKVCWNLLKDALAELPRHDIIRMIEKNFPARVTSPPSRVSNPPINPSTGPNQPPLLMQETSVTGTKEYAATAGVTQRLGQLGIDECGIRMGNSGNDTDGSMCNSDNDTDRSFASMADSSLDDSDIEIVHSPSLITPYVGNRSDEQFTVSACVSETTDYEPKRVELVVTSEMKTFVHPEKCSTSVK